MQSEEDKIKKKHLVKYANDSYERRDFEEAANTFSQLIKVSEQKDVEWFIKRCDCYQHLNLDSEAMNDADMVVKMQPKSYKGYSLRGALHQIQGHYDEALFCYFDCLEILWLSETNVKLPEVADKCLNDIIMSAQPVAELPENIGDETTLMQLYLLGNSLRREIQHTLAIRSMEVALIVCERSKNIDENLKMKIYFVLGQSKQGSEKYDEAIGSYRSSLSLALRLSDISYETKAYLNLSSLCLDQDRHSEAASYFIRLLAVGQDVLSAVGEDEEKFREHWSIEMEASILLNLCISFKWMRMYDKAIEFAERYDKIITRINTATSPTPDAFPHDVSDELRPKSVPTLGFSDTFLSQRSLDVSGMLQSKFILGDLHELRGDLDDALRCYTEWLKMSESLSNESEGLENTYLLDTTSALSCQGSVWLKKGDHSTALECFKKQTLLAKKTKVPQLMMESALSRGDALVGLRRTDEARKAYKQAQKLSRSLDDLEPECICMWKIASVFAAENRFAHAAYYCEQAVALASKCDKKSVQMKLRYELALYYQHSTSEKELRRAANILYDTITFQEKHISTYRKNGAKHFHDEEGMLEKCYVAMQVIFHKLGELELSAAFAEAGRQRKCLLPLKTSPQIPDISKFLNQDLTKEATATEEARDGFAAVKPHLFLPSNFESIVLTFSLCAEGFLVQIIGERIERSYLSSTFDAKPYETRPTIESLVAKLGKVTSKENEATHICNIYNCEPRNLPFHQQRPKISLPKFQKSGVTFDPASGDSVRVNNLVNGTPVEYGGGEGAVPDRKSLRSTLEELYVILIEPMEDYLSKLKPGSNVTIVPDDSLKQIPFDSLTNPSTQKLLGERFNVSSTPCTSFLKPSLSRYEKRNIVQRTSSEDVKVITRPATASSGRKQSTKQTRPKSSARKSPRRSTKVSDIEKEIQNYRRTELMKSYSYEADVAALEIGGFISNVSKLSSTTATGTNILSSPRYPSPYKQVTKKQKCSVVGCPSLPNCLQYRGETWHPPSKLPMALKESRKVAEYFDVIAAVGAESTKSKFIKELRTSTVLHICTFADLEKGLLAFSPDNFPSQGDIVAEESYLFCPEDLLSLRLEQLQLLVLSCGHGWPDCPMDGNKECGTTVKNRLAENFLAAGVSSVVSQLWNVPDIVKELFFFHFYNSLQTGCQISRAVTMAKNAVKEKHRDPVYWSGFVAIGNDVTVDLAEIRRSQLHASLDLAGSANLNLNSVVDEAVTPEMALEKLQVHFSQLTGYLPVKSVNRDIIGALIEVLEESMDRLTADSNTDRPIILLPDLIANARGAVGLLEELGFDFQPSNVPTPPPSTTDPSPFTPSEEVTAVVFPHWNKDGMLLPTHQALTGLQDVCSSDVALRCLARILPLKQTVLCSLIDLLAVTRHTPDVQLRVQDIGVQSLWNDRYIRQYLLEIGFMQIHDLVIFYKTSTNRTLLIASLQVFASLSLHRDQSVLERLNVSSLGQPPQEPKPQERKELKTVTPLILPRKEVILLSSWMKDQHPGEEEERGIKNLARKLQQAREEYERAVNHARWWHRNLLQPQAQMKLSEIGVEKGPKSFKRKVKPGATPSYQRESVNGTPDPHDRQPFFQTFAATMKNRDYANYLVQKRCDELESRYKSKVHEIYRQYAVNG